MVITENTVIDLLDDTLSYLIENNLFNDFLFKNRLFIQYKTTVTNNLPPNEKLQPGEIIHIFKYDTDEYIRSLIVQ